MQTPPYQGPNQSESQPAPSNEQPHASQEQSLLGSTVVLVVFGAIMSALLVLTYDADKSLALIFHPLGAWWAMAVHLSIVAIPLATPLLPEQDRRIAYGVVVASLAIAWFGNCAYSLAHAAGVPLRDVLDAWPKVSSGAALVALAGGTLSVALEAVSALLIERAVARVVITLAQRASQPAQEVASQLAPVVTVAPVLAIVPAQEVEAVQVEAQEVAPTITPLVEVLPSIRGKEVKAWLDLRPTSNTAQLYAEFKANGIKSRESHLRQLRGDWQRAQEQKQETMQVFSMEGVAV